MLQILRFIFSSSWRKMVYYTLFKDYFYKPERPLVWHSLYKDTALSTQQRRIMREAQLPREFTWESWDAARKFWNYRCAACGEAHNYLQKDHLVPLAHAACPGSIPSNLLPLCPDCNEEKSATDFTIWYKRKFKRYPDDIIEKIHMWQMYCLQRGWN